MAAISITRRVELAISVRSWQCRFYFFFFFGAIKPQPFSCTMVFPITSWVTGKQFYELFRYRIKFTPFSIFLLFKIHPFRVDHFFSYFLFFFFFANQQIFFVRIRNKLLKFDKFSNKLYILFIYRGFDFWSFKVNLCKNFSKIYHSKCNTFIFDINIKRYKV